MDIGPDTEKKKHRSLYFVENGTVAVCAYEACYRVHKLTG